MSRTGYALMRVKAEGGTTSATWLAAGSVKPEVTSDPIWLRGKMMALYLRQLVEKTADDIIDKTSADMNDAIWDSDPKVSGG